MSSEALEERLDGICESGYTFTFDGIEERDGDTLKIVVMTFMSEQDRDRFQLGMRARV